MVDHDHHEAAYTLAMECLSLIDNIWEHKRQGFLLQVARLLLDMGYTGDLYRIIELALKIEIEQIRVSTLAELALLCADGLDATLRAYVLDVAVEHVEHVERGSALQFELSKIALALSKIGDDRASRFLEDAIRLAERPTQLAWHWEETQAWANLAGALASVGLCDEALCLVEHTGLGEVYEDAGVSLVVELVVRHRWDDALHVLHHLHPIVQGHTLYRAATILAQRGKLDNESYRIVMTQLESTHKENQSAKDACVRIGQLIDMALLAHDEGSARQYLADMMDNLDETEEGSVGNTIGVIAPYAARLSERTVVRHLAERVQALPEGDGLSDVIGTVARALADVGQIDDAWSLAQHVIENEKRLDVCVYICESAHSQKKPANRYFNEALNFARQIANVGWIPSFWGRLAVLAHQLEYRSDVEECITCAIEGTRKVEPVYHTNFNIYNSANVARSLHQLGRSVQAHELLQYGLSFIQQPELDVDPVRWLVQAMITTEAKSLWSDLLQVACAIEDPAEKAEAILGITYAMARSGDKDAAIQNLPLVLAVIQDVGSNKVLIFEFGSLLREVLPSDRKALNSLISDAFFYARSQNRPTILFWIASLLPVFATMDSGLPGMTWKKIEQIAAMMR